VARVILQDVVKTYGSVYAVNHVSLTVEDGEFVALVGPSGCGKTTTLNLIAGLIELTDGEIYIGDRLVNDLDPKDRDIAMVFQNYALYPNKTVYKNLAFPLQMRRLSKPEIEKKVFAAAKVLDIEHLLTRRPRELSGGQQQRVALGRALVRDPRVFLMDEPLSNLDAKLRVQMRAELKRFHQDLNATVVYVTHDQLEAVTMADRMAVMNGGYLQQYDSPERVFAHPVNAFVAGFVGSPAMNLIRLKVTSGGEGASLVSDDGLSYALSPENTRKAMRASNGAVVMGHGTARSGCPANREPVPFRDASIPWSRPATSPSCMSTSARRSSSRASARMFGSHRTTRCGSSSTSRSCISSMGRPSKRLRPAREDHRHPLLSRLGWHPQPARGQGGDRRGNFRLGRVRTVGPREGRHWRDRAFRRVCGRA
jgi:multiple sugar transport system ATP-binding protein